MNETDSSRIETISQFSHQKSHLSMAFKVNTRQNRFNQAESEKSKG